ncbi:hypothetical protein SynBMKMC1_01966 [Synechococcus sp. BMK-MC-1]|nr:hypothetical protein SynBMKMC1_01966 [Synechococcus sp. BMK-MC-1]
MRPAKGFSGVVRRLKREGMVGMQSPLRCGPQPSVLPGRRNR